MSEEASERAHQLIKDLRKQLGRSDDDKIIDKLIREIKRLDGGSGSDKDYQATAERILKITRQ